jgi:uncharacterized protein with HEPN domain
VWRDSRDAILDMLQACEEIERFLQGTDPTELGSDLLRLRAIERNLAILGEAAKRVDTNVRDRYPTVPWRPISGLRDVLVHDYFGVDVAVLIHVVTTELPALRAQLGDVCRIEGWA